MQLKSMCDYIHQMLEPWRFRDYCPNGLQIEGRGEVLRLVSGVTANQALIEMAIAAQADAVLVHHGYFWRNEDPCIVGVKKQRLAPWLRHDISLLAYHLPLDAHPELGNNAGLARALGFVEQGRYGEQDLACVGSSGGDMILGEWPAWLEARLGHVPLVVGDLSRKIRRVAWCSGAAQSYFAGAIELGVDAFISGEISEPMVHLARETGVAYIAAGHHATERFGAAALGEHLAARFGISHQFCDVPSPV